MRPLLMGNTPRAICDGLIVLLAMSLALASDNAQAARTIFFESFENDTPDVDINTTVPESLDLYARSLVVPPPDPSFAYISGALFADPFAPNNQSLVLHNPNGAAQMAANFYNFFDADPTHFRNGVIEFDLYMEAAEPDSYWTFLDIRFGFDTTGPRTVSTQEDVTIWNAFRMQEGGAQPTGVDILYDYKEAQVYSDQTVVVPERKMHVKFDINGNSAPLPTYTVSIDNLEDPDPPVAVVWPADNVKPWFEFFNFETFMNEPAPGINVISFLTDASAHGLSQKSQNVYIDNLRVINNDLTPLDSADFDFDHDVDGADFLAWQRGNGITAGATSNDGDANSDMAVNATDFNLWKTQFGQPVGAAAVPEPSGATMAALALAWMARGMVQRSRRSAGASVAIKSR